MAKKSKAQLNKDKELLTRIRKRFDAMTSADEQNRDEAMYDMKFVNVPGHQWDANMKKERGDRPCYEFNKLRITGKRVINDMRANRAAGKVRAVEDGDIETAEVYSGLIRNISNVSDFDTITDTAAEYQVDAGMGAWRIVTEYSYDDAFDQDIKIEEISNPFCLFWDPSAQDQLKRDARDWILTDKMSKEEYEQKWPNAEVVSWDAIEWDDEEDWEEEEQIRVAEYWYKEPTTKTIYQLVDGKVINEEDAKLIDQSLIKDTREVKGFDIYMCIASGDAILEGPTKWAGSQFPFVVVFGEYQVIDGRKYWYGLPRFARDAQKSYNVARTAIAETIAQAPQAKWWATAEQAAGHVEKWAEAHLKNFPFLLYNPDPRANGVPQRMGGAEIPVALIQESQIASDEIKAVTGIYDASLGNRGNETSGIAIRSRAAQGEIATFNFKDNMAKGIRRTWELLVDLIPKIYDTERELRVLGNDGAEDFVKINTFETGPNGEPVKVNDLTVGKYDVTITVGPNFSTQRQEASETYTQLAQGFPQVMGVAGDLIFKSMDLPYADDIAERLKALLPPQIQQIINKDQQVPPEVQALMQQAHQAMQLVQQQMAAVQEAASVVNQNKSDLDKQESDLKILMANIKEEQAKFDADVAKELAKIADKQSKLNIAELQAQNTVEKDVIAQDKQLLAEQVQQSVQTINAMTADFVQKALQTMGEIKQTEKPKVVRIESRREKGKLVAVPIYAESD